MDTTIVLAILKKLFGSEYRHQKEIGNFAASGKGFPPTKSVKIVAATNEI
jgi:hypothetical protein